MNHMDTVEDAIRKALPTLQESDFNSLTTRLAVIGVRTDHDLQFITIEDIKDIIPLIAGRRLMHYLKNRDQEDRTSCQMGNTPGRSSYSEQLAFVPTQNPDWLSSYQIPWEKMPPNLRQCVAQGQRPKKQEQLSMVRIIVDSIREKCLNPTRSQCSEIAKRVTDRSPKSFADITMEGDLIGCGYGSLLNQLKTRVEHLNRDNTLARIRKPKRCSDGMEPPSSNEQAVSKCPKTDTYGCINWHPLDLPEGETPESLEAKKKEMITLFSQEGPRAAERSQVEQMMKITYAPQRYAINSNPPPSIDELKQQWPFLFMKEFLYPHFTTLTGIDVDFRLTESLCRKGKKIVHFFESQLLRWKKNVRAILKELDSPVRGNLDCGVAALLLTMAYFREEEDSLFLLADVTATPADVVGNLSVPSTPRLIALGDSFLQAKMWMLTMEGSVIIQPQQLTNFPSALAALLSCYYVFNVQYQEEAASTLEFIQRFILRLNPDGTKCQSKSQISRKSGKKVQRKCTNLNPHVASFIKELVDFDWQNY